MVRADRPFNRIEVLRKYYCLHCPNKSPRSTGISLLEQHILKKMNGCKLKVLDFGCMPNRRNALYLKQNYGCYVINIDGVEFTRPDVVAYPTRLPFRSNCCDIFVFSHILMFMNSKEEWRSAIEEIKRVTRKFAVIEVFQCKGKKNMRPHEKPLWFEMSEVINLITKNGLRIIAKKVDKRGLGVFLISK